MTRRLLLVLLTILGIGRLLRRTPADARGGGEAAATVPRRPGIIPGLPSVPDLLWAAALLLLAAGLAGALVLVSGLVPIKASSGHWAITRWFLNFASSRSVWTHSLGVTAPDLDDPALIMRGAGHFEGGCRACHGTTDGRLPPIAAAMTPTPPWLPEVLPQWQPRELFYIVKHGIKLTGMPAWPAQQRDDEVWAMVAFLRALPSLDGAGYRRLVHGHPPAAPALAQMPEPAVSPPREVLDTCIRCHGLDGQGRGLPAFPKLAGQRALYLENALRAYARGERFSGIMRPIASALSDESMRELARYYSSLPSAPTAGGSAVSDDEAARRGQRLATGGDHEMRVPACLKCHAPDRPANPAYPLLAGQYADYLRQQLKLFKEGTRGGSPYASIMIKVAAELTDEQMQDAARYFARLQPRTRETSRAPAEASRERD